MAKKISKECVEFVKKFEGFTPTATNKLDGVWTVGYGHTGKDVKRGTTYTLSRAEIVLVNDLMSHQKEVLKYDKIYDWTQSELDALTSFSFNCGAGNLKKLLDNGKRNREVIAQKILAYDKCNGRVLKGLARRRQEEQKMFLSGSKALLKTAKQVAEEVIAGRWGTGKKRKKALTDAGYDYDTIQSVVNKLMKERTKK